MASSAISWPIGERKLTGKKARLMDSKQITDALIQAFNGRRPAHCLLERSRRRVQRDVAVYLHWKCVSVLRLDRIGALEAKIRIEQDGTALADTFCIRQPKNPTTRMTGCSICGCTAGVLEPTAHR